jgi:protein-disulfide isomerase
MADSTETRQERRASARANRDQAAAAARQRRRLWQLGGVVALAAIVVAVIVIASSSGGGDSKPKKLAGESIPGQTETAALLAGIQQDGITLGDPKAPVTFVEFADLQCPFCRQYTTGVMPQLITRYVKAGKMKMVFRNVAFIGTDSARAGQMAAAAGLQNKLWTYIDLFYANQGEENSGYVTDDFLRKVGGGVAGLDVTKAMNDRGLPKVQQQLNEAQTEWQSNGFTGTPSFLVGRTGGTLQPLQISKFEIGQFTPPIDKLVGKQ